MQNIDIIINQDKTKDRRYDDYENLYIGNHYKVFSINQYEYFTDPNQYLVYNFPQILTNTINDLIWNEPPKFLFKNKDNQAKFDDFKSHSSLLIKLREATITSSYAGDAVLRLGQKNGEIIVEQIDNRIWYPIYNASNPRAGATGHILKYQKSINKDFESYLLEIHTAGQVEYQAYRKTNNEYNQVNPLQDWRQEMDNLSVALLPTSTGQFIYETKCKYPLVFQLSNSKMGNEFYGRSDYTLPIISKVFGVNSLLNQVQSVLRRHANPKMIVPRDVIRSAIAEITSSDDKAFEFGLGTAGLAMTQYNKDKTLMETIVASKIINKLEFFASDINGTEPKYLTWDGNLDASEKQVKTLLNACYEESQLSKILIDPTIATGNLSGVAIMRMSQQSLNKASKKQAYIIDTLNKLIYSWCQLSGLDAEYPSIQFKDGLVNDLKENIENQQLLLNSQLTTRLDAVMATRDMSQEQAQDVLDNIALEANLFNLIPKVDG